MLADEDPIVAGVPAEVPLPNAPLERVLAQLRFPFLASVESAAFIAPFQQALRDQYPLLRKEQMHTVRFGSAGIQQAQAQTAWRFHDKDEHWRVSLTSEFVAIETTKYQSRADFIVRLRSLLMATEAHLRPSCIDRLGVRYVDRIRAPWVDKIAALVRPEVSGISTTSARNHLLHTLSESRFVLDDSEFIARWGQLPAGVTHEPTTIEPIGEPSWILDLDMYTTKPLDFVADTLSSKAEHFTKRIYTFFRWTVTDEFLRAYGGTP